MANHHGEDVSRWDQARQLGQILVCGFDGLEVNDEVKTLIEQHHVGAIFLAPKNLSSAAQATKLCLDLQSIARSAGHIFPLLIAIDQENGGLNSLCDASLIHDFPSNLGLAAAASRSLARQVATATAQELKAVGINLILGPVLDVISDIQSQVLGPRSFGESPEEVSALGNQYISGCRDAGLASCGKHFPSFEKLELLRTSSTASLRDLSRTSLAPFRDAISQGIDAILVGDVAVSSSDVSEMHACLSERIVNGLLRNDMQFRGVVVSECLELSLSRDIGMQGAAVMAVRAGCDLVMVCRSLPLQAEALQGLELGIEGGSLDSSRVQSSVSRIIDLKTRCTSWEAALSPAGIHGLEILRKSHKDLSKSAYNRSITVVRDSRGQLPLTNAVGTDRPILLLTPLITPLPSSKYHLVDTAPELRNSELVFHRFGAILGKHASTKVIHTSYSAHGVRSRHEDLIGQAAAVVLVTADANRNKYQSAFAKHVTLLCNQKTGATGSKPCAVVAVTSPYDFTSDFSVDPYICTYDYTESALRSLVLVLCGETQAKGRLPGATVQSKARASRQQWLVEKFNHERDSTSLTNLLNVLRSDPETASLGLAHISTDGFLFHHDKIDNHHFVVRNSSTKELFGFCASYYIEENTTGYLGFLVVDPKRRKQSIGDSLHSRALHALQQIPGITAIKLGLPIPTSLPGIPGTGEDRDRLREWFRRRDWQLDRAIMRSRMIVSDLQGWKPPEGLSRSLTLPDVKYEIVQGGQDHALVFEHVRLSSSPEFEMLYKLAPARKVGNGVIKAKSLHDGQIIGTILMCSNGSELTRGMPSNAGFLTGPAVSSRHEHEGTIIQSLILLGLKQLKKQGIDMVLFEEASRSEFPTLRQWGFESVQPLEFDSVICALAPS